MSATSLARAAPVFAALGDTTRLEILARLGDGPPLSITCLSKGAKISRQAITKHLNALSKSGLVRSEQAGRERLYRVETTRLREMRRCLDVVSKRWDAAIESLRASVETG